MQTDVPPFSMPSSSGAGRNFLREKFPFIGAAIIIVGMAIAFLLISRGVIKTHILPQQKQTQPLTDEQKIQTLKKLSTGTPSPQSSDQQKLQTLQKPSQSQGSATKPQQAALQQSDADKLKILQQLSGK